VFRRTPSTLVQRPLIGTSGYLSAADPCIWKRGTGLIGRDNDDMNGTAAIWLPLLVLVPALLFWAYCLLDFTQTDEREMRTFTKPFWLVILLFGSVVGGLLWISVGRPQRPQLR
jgi:hypothetical protein